VSRVLTLIFGVSLVGCTAPPRALDGHRALARLSLDLRGTLPTIEEQDALDAGRETLGGFADAWLHGERFGERVRAWFAPVLRTRIDEYPVVAAEVGLTEEAAFQRVLGDQVPRMFSYVAEQDLPWTDLVTSELTMAEAQLASIFPVEPATGWAAVRWTDGRPSAGVLSTSSFYWRYPSAGVNYGRGRANAIARVFLCQDFLDRPVEFPRNIDLTDENAVNDAVRTDESCVNCHAALDGLASFLWGFQYADGDAAPDMVAYHPERERGWTSTSHVPPSYYGHEGFTLRDLGQQIAGDPRFVTCAVETVWEALLGREAAASDADALAGHREAFLDGGLRLRPLVRSVIADPLYLGEPDGNRPSADRKLLQPDMLGSAVEGLTGYRMTADGVDVLDTDRIGLRSLAGGVDGYTGAGQASVPTPSMLLVQRRLAEAAAFAAIAADAATPPGSARRLLPGVTFEERPGTDGEAAMRTDLALLVRRVLAARAEPDGPEVDALLSLWVDLYAMEPDALAAWAGVASAVLRDPDLLIY
jgi:hypothetical protein